eukprot:SAG31_NODE_2906_length_4924_cov_4.748187_6_plen_93_part_00
MSYAGSARSTEMTSQRLGNLRLALVNGKTQLQPPRCKRCAVETSGQNPPRMGRDSTRSLIQISRTGCDVDELIEVYLSIATVSYYKLLDLSG